MRRFVVVGLGRFGSWVARTLYAAGHDVVAFDRDPALVDAYTHLVTRCIAADAGEVEVLRRGGVEGAEAAVVSTGEDLAASILAILALRDLGVETIYAKVTSARAAQALERFEVTEMIFPEKEAAERLVRRLVSTTVLDYIPIGDGYSIQQTAVPDAWVGRSLRDLQLPKKFGVQVVGLHCMITSQWTVPPDADKPLKESDVALLAGSEETLGRLNRRIGRG